MYVKLAQSAIQCGRHSQAENDFGIVVLQHCHLRAVYVESEVGLRMPFVSSCLI